MEDVPETNTIKGGRNNAKSEVILDELEQLLKRMKNFNIHMNVLKKLLNLKEPEERYKGLVHWNQESSSPNKESLDQTVKSGENDETLPDDIRGIQKKMELIRKAVDESQILGFCLAFNVQRQQKQLTGLPIDANAADDVVRDLWSRFNESRSQEAILKYEFEEKRRLLRRLRKELDQARQEWKTLKIRIGCPGSATASNNTSIEDNESEASELPLPSESDSAINSDDGDDDVSRNSRDSRNARLENLERETLQFVSTMVNNVPGSLSLQTSREDREENEIENELFHSLHSPIPAEFLADDDLLDASSDDFDEEDEEDEGGDDIGGVIFPDVDVEDEDLLNFEAEVQRNRLPSDVVEEPNRILTASSSQLTLLTPDTAILQGVMATSTSSNGVTSTTGDINGLDASFARLLRISRASSSSTTDDEDERRFREEAESLAETGEPLVLCRLRRKAVEVLISRLREEKAFHEAREKELEQRLQDSLKANDKLRQLSSSGQHIFKSPFRVFLGLTLFAINLYSVVKFFS